MQIVWLSKVLDDLEEIVTYIVKDNQQTAEYLFAYIYNKAEILKDFPKLGRQTSIYNVRELVIDNYPYVVPYRVKNEVIQILRVFHTSRKSPQFWQKSLSIDFNK